MKSKKRRATDEQLLKSSPDSLSLSKKPKVRDRRQHQPKQADPKWKHGKVVQQVLIPDPPPPENDDDKILLNEDGEPLERNAANARERARMRVLSKAFVKLKTTLPWVPPDTKLSKLDTLRLATSYIAHLRDILIADDQNNQTVPTSSDQPESVSSAQAPNNLMNPFPGTMSIRRRPSRVSETRTRRGGLSVPNSPFMHPLELTWPFAAAATGSGSDFRSSATFRGHPDQGIQHANVAAVPTHHTVPWPLTNELLGELQFY